MNEDRAEKRTVRNLWVSVAKKKWNSIDSTLRAPFYVTLSGREGKEIDLLIKEGLIRTNETGSILEEDIEKVVAIENNAEAVLHLQRKHPGLKILERDFANLLRGNRATSLPTGDDKKICQAAIINLDLNAPLNPQKQGDRSSDFPLVEIVKKIALLQADLARSWTLFLTIHAEARWTKSTCEEVQIFFKENFKLCNRFAEKCRVFWGDRLFESICTEETFECEHLSIEDQQKLLMVFFPKKLSSLIHNLGWRLEFHYNLRYGGTKQRAPIVTWLIDLNWDNRKNTAPVKIYIESINNVFCGVGRIEEDGTIFN